MSELPLPEGRGFNHFIGKTTELFTKWIKPFNDQNQLTFDPEASLQIGTGKNWHFTFENFKVENYAQYIEAELLKLLKAMPYSKDQTIPKLELK